MLFRSFSSQGETIFYVQLINNGESGSGNDILLDDINFSICLPKVTLITSGADTTNIEEQQTLRICNDTTIVLRAYQQTKILENSKYLFQYLDNNSVWKDVKDYNQDKDYEYDTISISTSDARFMGDVKYRVILAEDINVLNKVAKIGRAHV